MKGEASSTRYLSGNGKSEIRRLDAKITDPSAAYREMTDLMNAKWYWGVLPHNCAAVAKEIIQAGGGDLTVMLNCPDHEFVHSLSRSFEGGLTIYSVTGI